MLKKGLLGYLPVNIVQALAGFGSIMIFTRLLSPSGYGAYALAFSVTSLVYLACLTWIEAAMARFYAVEKTEAGRANLYATLYRTFAVMMFAAPIIGGVIVTVLPLPQELKVAIAAGLVSVVFRSLLRLAQERRRAAGEVRGFAVIDIVQTGAGFLIGAALVFVGLGAAGPLAGAGVASALCLVWALPSEIKVARRGVFERKRLFTYVSYGLPVSLSLMMSLALATTDRFVLAGYLNEAAVGAYHAGYSLSNRTLDVMFLWLGMARAARLHRGAGARRARGADANRDTPGLPHDPDRPARLGRPDAGRQPPGAFHGWVGAGGKSGARHALDRRRRLPLRHHHPLLQLSLRAGATNQTALSRHRHSGGAEPHPRAVPGAAVRARRRHVGDGDQLWDRPACLRLPGSGRHRVADPVDHLGEDRRGDRRHGVGRIAPSGRWRTGRAFFKIGRGRPRLCRDGPDVGRWRGETTDRRHRRIAAREARLDQVDGMSTRSVRTIDNANWASAEPKLSVVMPFFRYDPILLLARLDAEARTFGGAIEILALDDGGGDKALAERVAGTINEMGGPARLILLTANEGRARGRNRLVDAARARHILLIDCDMAPDAPDFLARYMTLVDEDVAVAFGGFSVDRTVATADQELHRALQLRAECLPAKVRQMQPEKYVYTSNLLVRRDVFGAEAFDEGFTGWGWEDVEWGMRVASKFDVRQIENTATHLGLDTAAVLANKYEQSVANFARVVANHPQIVVSYPSYRMARILKGMPQRTLFRSFLKQLALQVARAPHGPGFRHEGLSRGFICGSSVMRAAICGETSASDACAADRLPFGVAR